MYIKSLVEVLDKPYKEVCELIKEVYPDFVVKAGPNTTVDEPIVKNLLAKNGFVYEDGNIKKYINTDTRNVKLATDKIELPKQESRAEKSLREYNELKAEIVDPLKVKAEMGQTRYTLDTALEKVETLNKNKTILTDAMLGDDLYLRALFNGYPILICPMAFGFHLRNKFKTMFINVLVTDTIGNRLIAFNEKEALISFVINL